MGDQGAGGIESRGVESNTTRRMSEPRPNSHDDQIQQKSSETKAPNTESEEQKYAQTGPRHLVPVHPGNPTSSGGLSRNPSTSSNVSRDSRILFEFSQRPRASRPLEPPVTKATLSELDVNKIIHNPKLRHDINFDPDLHFRPNVDGEKGRRKQEKANQFWNTLTEQLQLFIMDRDEFMARFGQGEEWCLPQLLKSVKEIIQTLVPQRDRMYLDEGLNVDLIMQQFSKGMADLEKLASWLSGVLKSHCAPMRDEWVDEMYNQLTNGNKTNDMEELVQGMRSLLSVLEAMKLDVANHQIRCLRPILIEDTVHFEQRFFLKKIRDRKMDPSPAQAWYLTVSQYYSRDPASVQAFGEMGVFFEALCKMILPSTDPYSHPDTFVFDEERMAKLRSDMLDAINLEICMRLYENLERRYRYCDSMSSVSSIPAPFLSTPFSDASGFLRTEDDDSAHSRPSSLVFSSAGSAHSSPRASLILPTQPAANRPEDQQSKSKNLYNSLVALLQTSPASSRSVSRWKAMKDSLALQIFRYTNAPAQDLLQFEDELDNHLSELSSPLFQQVEQYYHYHLLVETRQRVKDFRGLTGAALFSVATGGRLHGPNRTFDGPRENTTRERTSLENAIREAREEGGVEDMATRLAHMGLLHWRVWSHLAYAGDLDSIMAIPDMPMAI
ncbi:T-complex 11 [Annulohypoxylon maeteangense]|uniref:T-complex 11 n=1 Tax=Annulohypoxylon maeteangense TaxID=1927788 RepID=UPI00200870BE|nr:T-complex 11 [Annulohypoxylon maeteangense]KAI0884865.1 T-complex 11 [Annulohypoxylon maeteangense]